jgi:DNA polymerase-3 subunit epsilon/CBS domain-containing protein
MQRLGFRHLAVRSAEGSLVGVVTPRDLLRNRVSTALVLGDHIDSATDAPSLGEAWSKLPLAAASLLADGVDARAVAAVASAEICAMTRRAAELAVERMAKAGKGAPPVRYAVLALGSAGRGESLLAADQDNAIVYEDGAVDPRAVDAWFEELGAHIADTLDAAGVPYCKGGVMARNADWRKSVGAWKETIEGWVRRQRPRDLLNVDIFFDAVPVHGVNGLGEAVWNYAFDIAHRNVSFIKLLTELARDWRAPTTLFGGIRTDAGGRVDLKKGGLLPLFTAARVLAIRHDVRERSTPARLTGVARKGVSAVEAEARGIIAAHGQLLDLLLRQQLADAEAGIPLSSRVDPSRLSKEGRDALRASLRQVRVAIDLVGEGRF